VAAVIAVAIVIGFVSMPPSPAVAALTAPPLGAQSVGSTDASLQVTIEGRFRDFTTGQVIGGARITVSRADGTLAGTAIADTAGDFALAFDTAVGAKLTASYEAVGYLREESVLMATEPQVALDPLLTPRGVEEAVHYSLSETTLGRQPARLGSVAVAYSRALLGAAPTTPATIRVYRTHLETPVVQVVDFKFYCKHVLPCEWLTQWPTEALRAGAIAVKEYAWFYISKGGKYPNSTYPTVYADVTDGWEDQWYDPAVSNARTDAAVDYIWDKALLKDGALFMLQYCGHSDLDEDYRCPLHLTRMPQWGTYYLAQDKGWDWQQIIHYYWDPVSIVTLGGTSVPCTTIRGTDRYDTAILLSKAMYPEALPAGSGLVLAPGETFQEALCGAPLAAAYGGPVLLTYQNALANNVRDEIERLAPAYVVCVGVSDAVVTAVEDAVPAATVTSITGADVYDMSYQVAEALDFVSGGLGGATAIITRGDVFPDAIGASPLACAKSWPILLTEGATGDLNQNAAAALDVFGITSAIKVGTYAKLPTGIDGLANLSGADRYETNRNVAVWGKSAAGLSYSHLGIATGDKFPDALAAGPYMAQSDGILLLSPLYGPLPACISYAIAGNAESIDRVTFVAMIEPVISQVQALLP